MVSFDRGLYYSRQSLLLATLDTRGDSRSVSPTVTGTTTAPVIPSPTITCAESKSAAVKALNMGRTTVGAVPLRAFSASCLYGRTCE